jgi:hypothetical protein
MPTRSSGFLPNQRRLSMTSHTSFRRRAQCRYSIAEHQASTVGHSSTGVDSTCRVEGPGNVGGMRATTLA